MIIKKVAKLFILANILLAVFLFTGNAFASEKINRFDTEITVLTSGLINVVENIEYDFGTEQRHGIFRDIPVGNVYTIEHAPRGGNRIDVLSVTDEKGQSYQNTVSDTDGIKNIKIGDPNTTITGIHTYTINYTVKNALGYFDNYDEIYWNVTGNNWQVPIEKATATIKLPNDAKPMPDKIKCYTGFKGEAYNCETTVTDNESSTKFFQNNLQPGQGLSVAVGFEKGLVPNYVYVAKWYNNQNNYYKIAFGVFILGLLLLLRKIFIVSLPDIREKTKPIIAQFEPPAGMTPSEAGYIYNQNLSQNNRSLAGDILYLATEGYVTIENKPLPKISYIKKIIPKIFVFVLLLVGFGLIVKNFDSIIVTIYIFIMLSIVAFFGFTFFFKRTQTSFTRTGKSIFDSKGHLQSLYSIITNPTGSKTTDDIAKEQPYFLFESYFNQARSSANPNSPYVDINKMWTLEGTVKVMFGAVKAMFKFFFSFFLFLIIIFVLIAAPNIVSDITGVSALIVALPILIIFGFFILFKIAKYIYKKIISKTSAEYYAVAGLYRYIKVAEKSRLMSEYSSQDLPRVFSKLLPFAVALGLGGKWIKAFDGLLTANPVWYHGNDAYTSFSSGSFASSISGLSSSMSSASSSGAPQSSGGGSSGGGSSGGGGGGGGGGSW